MYFFVRLGLFYFSTPPRQARGRSKTKTVIFYHSHTLSFLIFRISWCLCGLSVFVAAFLEMRSTFPDPSLQRRGIKGLIQIRQVRQQPIQPL